MTAPAAATMAPPTAPKRLYRSRTDRKIFGVCGGLAEYFGMDPTLVRVLWVILSIFPGSVIGGILVYLVCFLLIPEEPVAPQAGLAPYVPPAPPQRP